MTSGWVESSEGITHPIHGDPIGNPQRNPMVFWAIFWVPQRISGGRIPSGELTVCNGK